jgi:branched-chain amino acid transport system substrate-binding protein
LNVSKKRRLCIAAVLTGALVLSACGSDSKSTSTTAAPTTTASAATATTAATSSSEAPITTAAVADKSPIILGNVGSYTGPTASNTGGVRRGLELWQKYVNDNGGINGHPVQIEFVDDTGDPTKTLTEVTSLVEDKHIVAMLNPASSTVGWQQYLSDKGIPSINASGYNFAVPGLSFNASTDINTNNKSQVMLAKNAGAKSYAFIYCGEIADCESGRDANKAEAEAQGLTFSTYKVSGSDPDFTSVCLTMKGDGVESVALDAFPANSARLVEDCSRQDFHPQWITVGVAITAEMATNPNFEGLLVSTVAFPWFQNDTPATKTFQAAVQKYDPAVVKDPAEYNANFSASWAAGTVLLETAKLATDPTNSKDLITGLATVDKDNFGGLTPPLTFKTPKLPDDPTKYVQPDSGCFFAIQMTGGQWTKPKGDLVDENFQVCI